LRLTFPALNKLASLALYADREGWQAPEVGKTIVLRCNGKLYKNVVLKRMKGKDDALLILDQLTVRGRRAYSQLRKILQVLGVEILKKPRVSRSGILFHTMFDPSLAQVNILLAEKEAVCL
jgi:hypothetical protein